MSEIFASVIKNIAKFFEGNYIPAVLFALAVVVMIFVAKKHKEVIWYCLVLTVVILFPVTAKIIMYGIGKSVYWRMLWLYPAVPMVAVALTYLVQMIQKKSLRFLCVIAFCAAIAITGECVVNRDTFDRAYNYEKIPEYVVAVCDMINEDAVEQNITDKKLATCADFLLYVREYDATLKMENSRENIRGYDDRENASLIFQGMCGTEAVDYDLLASLLREENCNYVIVNLEFQAELAEELKNRSFSPIGDYGQFEIFRDGLLNTTGNIETNQVVTDYYLNPTGLLIGQYPSLTNDQSSFYTITDSDGHLIVIDGGWEGDAEYVREVVEYFGGKIDAWMITHPHFDHIRAFNKLFASENCPEIGTVYVSEFNYEQYKEEAKQWDQFEDYETFLAVTQGSDKIQYLHAGDCVEICGITVDVYHDYTTKDGGDACNDGSLVFEVYGESESMLFCGDTGEEQSECIIEAFGDKLSADYLQMGHHGNGGLSEEFYQLVSPKVAFFDAPEWLMNPEEGSSYTTPENRELMESMGAEIYYFATAPNYIVLQ